MEVQQQTQETRTVREARIGLFNGPGYPFADGWCDSRFDELGEWNEFCMYGRSYSRDVGRDCDILTVELENWAAIGGRVARA